MEVDRRIQAAPDVVWVGLSTPEQERWMYEHRPRLTVPLEHPKNMPNPWGVH
jgi:UDP-N-acetyl-D-mannosaminuronic acid transferase (WecB/TagA/CpsF family)